MRFYLGTHKPHWLALADYPLFVSHRRLREYKTMPRARTSWALDSGGFTELSRFGRWTISAAEYAEAVKLYQRDVGRLEWVAIQDWMCEPFILAKTGKTIVEHQYRTIDSYLELKALAPAMPCIPILQGWTLADYLRHVDMWNLAIPSGLAAEKIVGVGSICRRQGTKEALGILEELHSLGLRLHGFGFKTLGLLRGAVLTLASADSMAWSLAARREDPLPGCPHKSCANCRKYATKWRGELLARISQTNFQPSLFQGTT